MLEQNVDFARGLVRRRLAWRRAAALLLAPLLAALIATGPALWAAPQQRAVVARMDMVAEAISRADSDRLALESEWAARLRQRGLSDAYGMRPGEVLGQLAAADREALWLNRIEWSDTGQRLRVHGQARAADALQGWLDGLLAAAGWRLERQKLFAAAPGAPVPLNFTIELSMEVRA